MASKGKSDHYHREAPQPKDGDVARIQMEYMFVGAEGTFVDEPRAKATVLNVICKDDDNLSATEVRAKTDEMVLRFLRLERWNVRMEHYLDVQERMKVRIIPGTQLFPWMLRHSCVDSGALPVRSKNETDSV